VLDRLRVVVTAERKMLENPRRGFSYITLLFFDLGCGMEKLSAQGKGETPIDIYHKGNCLIWVNQWSDIGSVNHVILS
jgi:hypothetical protein